MTVQKIRSGRIGTIDADQYLGERGTIFYNEALGDLRLSDGETFGGIPLTLGGGGGSFSFRTIVVDGQLSLVAGASDTLRIVAGPGMKITTNPAGHPKSLTLESTLQGIVIDGGRPDSIYGGINPIDAGSIY
jgi:hypothetical protein